MMFVGRVFAMRAGFLSLGVLVLAASSFARSEDEGAPIALVPHRAIYDLSLGTTRGNSQLAGVRGRILYDFGGSACQGYSLDFRQVSELDSGEGKVSTSDLRSTTWEGADAKSFKFTSQNFVDENLVDSVDGRAERETSKTAVALEKPRQKSLSLAPGVVFPTEHMVRAIKAARAGQAVLSFPVYDGSETGDKVFDTLTVIGRAIQPGERNHDDAAVGEPKLASVPRWPVTVSYFERGKADTKAEQLPAYAISFELYANGISRALALDYNNFVINGKLASIDIKDAKPCR
ncbi:MAG: cell envelope integrity EipB family protein [Xanthobacteraceae bacterium]